MFTLGYAAPVGDSTTLEYLAAFTGLVVIGLQVGYLPTLYAAFNRRETEVSLLVSRAGVPAWGPEILARTRWGIYEADIERVLDELFTAWERWAAEVAESHSTYLTLTRLRSPRPLSHWLISLIAVMDAAALHLALAPSQEPKLAARLCLRMGFVALDQIARTMRLPVPDETDPDAPVSVSFDHFREAAGFCAASTTRSNGPTSRPGRTFAAGAPTTTPLRCCSPSNSTHRRPCGRGRAGGHRNRSTRPSRRQTRPRRPVTPHYGSGIITGGARAPHACVAPLMNGQVPPQPLGR